MLKPTLTLYKKEVKRRHPTIPLSNKKMDSILSLLRGQLRLNNSQDIQFVIKMKDKITAALLNAVGERKYNNNHHSRDGFYLRLHDDARSAQRTLQRPGVEAITSGRGRTLFTTLQGPHWRTL
jgi:hypothetical protein